MMARSEASENAQPEDVFDTGIRAEDLDPERPRPVETPWGSFALYVVETRVVAAQSFCPHLEGPLFEGSVAGAEVTCPWHRWRFDLETGERVDVPDPEHRLRRCAVRTGANGTLELEAPRD